jgi:hypothetical protein
MVVLELASKQWPGLCVYSVGLRLVYINNFDEVQDQLNRNKQSASFRGET